MKKVLVADKLSDKGLDSLRQCAEVDVKTGLKPEELKAIIGQYDALLVRSQTQVTADIIDTGSNLQVIGRAGVGVDNIDMGAATRHGVIVVNAPTGNTVSAAEHSVALMLSLARHIPAANSSLKAGEWRRGEFMGTEINDKVLGIIGLGNIGSEVASRARAFNMKLIAFDPFVSIERAQNLQVALVSLEELIKEADFITLHVPMTAQTKMLIGAKELAMMKPTARIINAARGGLIDEEALATAVKEGKLAGAAVDVFPKEPPPADNPLFGLEKVIVTPHLGASTSEAQALAASDVVKQVIDVFNGKSARYAVNAPFISAEQMPLLAPFIEVAHSVGRLVSQLSEGQMKTIKITYAGELAEMDTNALKAITVGGILEQMSEDRVNMVNANLLACQRGLNVVEEKDLSCENFTSMITVESVTTNGQTSVSGTVVRDETHIVKVNEYWIDIVPTGGFFLFSDHQDMPGLIGAVGKITGDADINVSFMHLSRQKPRGQALMIMALDEPLKEEQRQKVLALPKVQTAKIVKL